MPTAMTMSQASAHMPEYMSLSASPVHMNYMHLTQSMDPHILEDTYGGEKMLKHIKLEGKPVVVRQRKPGGGKTQTPSVLRRNERERNRVKLVNDGFLALRQRVPCVSRSKKLSKVDTLRAACDYIHHLKSLLNDDDATDSSMVVLPAAPATTTSPSSSSLSPSSSSTTSPTPTSPCSSIYSTSPSPPPSCLSSSPHMQAYFSDSRVEQGVTLHSISSTISDSHQICAERELATELSGFGTWFD